jgi:glycosyltransferase involved in cell wall biosynthesis
MLLSEKKRLLIFIGFYKPGFLAGGPIQSVSNLCKLIGNDYEIGIITQNFDFGQTAIKYDLQVNKWQAFIDGTRVKYKSIQGFKFTAIAEIFKMKPSIIYINSFFSISSQVQLASAKIYSLFHRVKIIVAPRGELDPGALSLKAMKKQWFVKAFRLLFGQKLTFHATTSMEAQSIANLFPKSLVICAENIPQVGESGIRRFKQKHRTNFLFLSRITPKKNLIFCLEILCRMRVEGEITFTIAGPIEDVSYWEQCSLLITHLPENIKCLVIGSVPHSEVRKVLKANHFLFLPTLGENFGHIIFEALNTGMPVLLSDQTPWKTGLDNNGVYAFSLNDDDAFIKSLTNFHDQTQSAYDAVSMNAFNFSRNSIDLDLIKHQYEDLFTA